MKLELLFTPLAWRKLVFLRDLSNNEVGALGISIPGKPLVISDLLVPKQVVSSVSVAFDMDSVSDLYAEMSDRGKPIEEFARVWIHTHPGNSATPSGTDEQTFRENYGACDWSVMFILSKSGATTARLHLKNPRMDVPLGVGIDWSTPFSGTNEPEWRLGYAGGVSEYVPPVIAKPPVLVSKSANVREPFGEKAVITADHLWERESAYWWDHPENEDDEDLYYEDIEDEIFYEEMRGGKE